MLSLLSKNFYCPFLPVKCLLSFQLLGSRVPSHVYLMHPERHQSHSLFWPCAYISIIHLITNLTLSYAKQLFPNTLWTSWEQWMLFKHAAAKSLQSCPTLCDPIDGSPPGSPIPGILQAGILEWVAISFSNVWKWKVKVKSLSRVWLLVSPWTEAHQAPPSMGFSKQEYWSGMPLPSPNLSIVVSLSLD